MKRRVERIARQVMGDSASVTTDALTWAGTFHGIGARLSMPIVPIAILQRQFELDRPRTLKPPADAPA